MQFHDNSRILVLEFSHCVQMNPDTGMFSIALLKVNGVAAHLQKFKNLPKFEIVCYKQ